MSSDLVLGLYQNALHQQDKSIEIHFLFFPKRLVLFYNQMKSS